MQTVNEEDRYNKAKVIMLPIIDLNPSDESCIYSTLLYIQQQARELNIPTPCVTFDQPLYAKAVEIVAAKHLNVVVRLGGFHTLMSFVGIVGFLMEGSGIEDVLQTVYGGNAIVHMLSGKAIAIALRGHFLCDSVLMTLLMNSVLPQSITVTDVNQEDGFLNDPTTAPVPLTNEDLTKLQELYDQLMKKEVSIFEVENCPVVIKLKEAIEVIKEYLLRNSRTAKLFGFYNWTTLPLLKSLFVQNVPVTGTYI